WAQDALAMDNYAGSSAAAAKVTPFTVAPQITNASGMASQAAAVTQAAATPAGSAQSLLTTFDPLTTANPVLQWLANLSTDYTNGMNNLLNGLFGPGGASLYTGLFTAVKAAIAPTQQVSAVGMLANFPVSQFLKFNPVPAPVLP